VIAAGDCRLAPGECDRYFGAYRSAPCRRLNQLALDLDTRTGWPAELHLLLDRYPRAAWLTHANLGAHAGFWLQRHTMFRELADLLDTGTADLRAEITGLSEFRSWFAPRLQFFLSELEVHHQVEDDHYFPRFRAAEPRLTRGFEVLEQDHHAIHESMAGVVEAANALLRGGGQTDDTVRRSAESYAVANDRMLKWLRRHLDDEEDLVVPLVLDRGEGGIGFG
jgi:hypothetical protein